MLVVLVAPEEILAVKVGSFIDPACLPHQPACQPCQPACLVSLPALSACLSCQPACLVSLPALSACLPRQPVCLVCPRNANYCVLSNLLILISILHNDTQRKSKKKVGTLCDLNVMPIVALLIVFVLIAIASLRVHSHGCIFFMDKL
jgi:hypothetical protein